MAKFFQRIFNNFKDNRHRWKKRAGMAYAIGVWTSLGALVTYAGAGDIWKKFNEPIVTLEDKDEENIARQQKLAREDLKRSKYFLSGVLVLSVWIYKTTKL